MLNICALSSGSSGNAIYVGTERTKILVDAGISAREISRRLSSLGVAPHDLAGILITHEHTDHIRGLRVFVNRYQIPVYSTEETWYYLEKQMIPLYLQRVIHSHGSFAVEDLQIESFPIPHDAADPVGFKIGFDGKALGVVTDLGHIPAYLHERLDEVQLIFLEANHDVDTLKRGTYPAFLKQRILGHRGHLSNDTAGDFVSVLAGKGLKKIMLGHLSQNNNTPKLALSAVAAKLGQIGCQAGVDIQIDCCHHGQLSGLITI